MKGLLNNLLISIGISLIVGVFVGQSKKIEKYYSINAEKPKREITKEAYNAILIYQSYKKHLVAVEKQFNTLQAVTFGILSLGACLAIIGVSNKLIQFKKNK
jgi:hypothetical protein